MKKRILIVLAILVLVSLTVLAACDTHEHEYSWKSDEHGHWQECVCGDKTDKVAHSDGDDADELCDACGYNLHAHAYEWKFDAVNHWEECSCGDKKTAAPHADVKNNQNADEADGKCDVCGVEVYVVSYDMQGHGIAPQAQLIAKDGKAVAPQAPADDDAWSFDGWYKEASCENAFNFATETITAATTLYAKWTEDETEGASKAHAYELTLDFEDNKAIAKDQVIYFAYTAQENGRYTIALGSGLNSQKCAFTTDKTEGTYNADNEQVNIDLAKDETVYVALTCTEELSADAMACVIIANCTGGDALPADLFLSGEYTDGNYLTFEFNRETMKISYLDKEHNVSYIGGEYNNKLVATIAGDYMSEAWTITPNEDGSYTLLADDGWWPSTKTVHYVKPQAPVALSEIVGYYEPTEEAYISELYIYAATSETETSVRVLQGGYYSEPYDATYNTEKNKLTFNYNVITLKLADDNSVEGVILNGVTYERKGDLGVAPPATLPIAENAEYNGATNAIRTTSGTQYFGATGYDTITVMNYAEQSGKYTVLVSSDGEYTEYQLTISQDGKTIELYNAEGEKIDTLVKYEWIYHDLNAVAATLTLNASDFQRNIYLLTAKQSAWYKFDASEGAVVYSKLNPNNYTDFEYSRAAQADIPMYLAENTVIAVYMETPAEATIAITIAEAPAGTEQSKPVVITDGAATVDVVSTQTYYFKYTASEAGTYLVKVTYGLLDSPMLLYTVNETPYGYDGNSFSWIGGLSYSDPYAVVTVTGDNLVLDIRVNCEDSYGSVTVTVSEDYSADATNLTLTGEAADDNLVVTATAATGANYGIASTKGQAVVVTGNAAFTVILQGGITLESEEDEGVHTVLIPEGKNVYFKLQSETQQTLTLSQTFAKGSEGYPVEVALTDGVGTIEVQVDLESPTSSIYFTVAPGTYSMSAPAPSIEWYYINLYKNGTQLSNGQVFTVEEGDVLSCIHGDEVDVIVTITKVTYVFSEAEAGTYKGTGASFGTSEDVTLTFDRFGLGTFTMSMGTFEISIKEEDGVYSFSYNDGNQSATFTFSNGNILLDDKQAWYDEAFTMEKEVAALEGTYIGTLENGNAIEIVISGDKVTYSIDLGSGLEVDANNAVLSENEGVYSFQNTYGDTHTFTVSEDRNTIIFSDGYYMSSGTLTKQA